MKRAKFEGLRAQRDFFIKVKKKLRIGSKRLSERLGLKSRGSIESYTFMRTAPPVNIIKKLEKISGIKAKYQEIEGKIYRKKRGFIPMKSEVATKILKSKFGKDFDYLTNLIKSDLSIKEIISKIRKKKYSLDNSKIGCCIGAYRTNLLSKIVKEVIPGSKEIIVRGFIRKDNKTLAISFNLSPLYKILKQKDSRIGLEISEDRKRVKIFPLKFGRKLIKSNGAIKILITEKSNLKVKSNIEIVLSPKKFGFDIIDSIYDADARVIAKEALKEGFILDNYRSTPSNHKGDLSLYKDNKNIVVEITQASSYKANYFKIGQCFIQKISWPKSIQFLICKKEFLTKDSVHALNKMKVRIIYTDFNKEWGECVMKKIKNGVGNED